MLLILFVYLNLKKKKTIVDACNYRRINSDNDNYDADRVTGQKNGFSFVFFSLRIL